MVDFKGMLSYFKSVGFAGPVELYQEYHVTVSCVPEPVNMLGTDFGKWKLEMPKAQYVSLLKRDVTSTRTRWPKAVCCNNHSSPICRVTVAKRRSSLNGSKRGSTLIDSNS